MKKEKIRRQLRNGILSLSEIALVNQTSINYVEVIRSQLKRPEYYDGYNTRKMREYRGS